MEGAGPGRCRGSLPFRLVDRQYLVVVIGWATVVIVAVPVPVLDPP